MHSVVRQICYKLKTFPVIPNYFHECVISWHNACSLMVFYALNLYKHFLPITGLFVATLWVPRIQVLFLFTLNIIARKKNLDLMTKSGRKWSRFLWRKGQEMNVALKLEDIILQVIFPEVVISEVIEGYFSGSWNHVPLYVFVCKRSHCKHFTVICARYPNNVCKFLFSTSKCLFTK